MSLRNKYILLSKVLWVLFCVLALKAVADFIWSLWFVNQYIFYGVEGYGDRIGVGFFTAFLVGAICVGLWFLMQDTDLKIERMKDES